MKKMFALLLVIALVFAFQPVVLLAAEHGGADMKEHGGDTAAAPAAVPAPVAAPAPAADAAAPAAEAKAGGETVGNGELPNAGEDDAATLKQAAAALKATNDPKNAELAKKLEDMAADYEW